MQQQFLRIIVSSNKGLWFFSWLKNDYSPSLTPLQWSKFVCVLDSWSHSISTSEQWSSRSQQQTNRSTSNAYRTQVYHSTVMKVPSKWCFRQLEGARMLYPIRSIPDDMTEPWTPIPIWHRLLCQPHVLVKRTTPGWRLLRTDTDAT